MAYTGNIIPVMTSTTEPSGWVTSSAYLYEDWRAFDHVNPATEVGAWLANVDAAMWLQYQFPSAHVVARYAIASRNSVTYPIPPKSWYFKGSNDGTTWVTLDTQTDVIDWAALPNVRKVFDISNALAYAYYRLDITASNDATFIGVGELEMMETALLPVIGGRFPVLSRVCRGI